MRALVIGVLAMLTSCKSSVPTQEATSAREQESGDDGGCQDAATAGQQDSPMQRSAIDTPDQALAAFEAGWELELVPALSRTRPEVVTHWQNAMTDPMLHRSASRMMCREASARVRDTLTPGEETSILYGEVANLDRDEDCWEVHVSLGFSTLLAYFLAETGALLFAWAPPEG